MNYYLRLKKQGIVPHTCMNHGFTTSLYYLDPDGNEVEIQVDNFKTKRVDERVVRDGRLRPQLRGLWLRPGVHGRAFPRRASPEDQILQHDLYR